MHSRRSFAPAAPPIGQANFFTGELAISVAALEPKPADGDPPVVGVMNLRAMAVVAAAITVERLAPAGERFARAIGAVVVGAGGRALGLAGGFLFLVASGAGRLSVDGFMQRNG